MKTHLKLQVGKQDDKYVYIFPSCVTREVIQLFNWEYFRRNVSGAQI